MSVTKVLETIQSGYWSPSLKTHGEVLEGVDDIAQCIEIILLTPKGSIPHRPNFASDIPSLVDLPQTAIGPRLIAAVYDAILTWEPRVELVKVAIDFNSNDDYGKVDLYIDWRLKTGGIVNQTVVTA